MCVFEHRREKIIFLRHFSQTVELKKNKNGHITHRENNKLKKQWVNRRIYKSIIKQMRFNCFLEITFEIKKFTQDPDNTGWLNKTQPSVLFTKNFLFWFQVETNKTIVFVLLFKQNASYMMDVFLKWYENLHKGQNISKVQFVKCS